MHPAPTALSNRMRFTPAFQPTTFTTINSCKKQGCRGCVIIRSCPTFLTSKVAEQTAVPLRIARSQRTLGGVRVL